MAQTMSADLTVREFNRRVADPDEFSGGGSVAALAAAGAASAALLVMRLNRRRRANAPRAAVIDAAISEVEAAVERLYQAADDDLAALDALLVAQRVARDTGSRAQYVDALHRAAGLPVAVARDIERLLGIIETQLSISTRFTVSDLAAAAALLDGAARAALVTARVNLALLRDEPGADRDVIEVLSADADDVRHRIGRMAAVIEGRASQLIDSPRIAKREER